MSQVTLSEALSALRSQLTQALSEGEGEIVGLKVNNIELELELGLTKGVEGEAGVKWWVIQLGTQAKSESQQSHRVKLMLGAIDKKTGKDLQISKNQEQEFE